MKKQLTLIRGLPGSGKSTLARFLKTNSVLSEHLEADMFFENNGVYNFDINRLAEAHDWCRESTELHLSKNRHVIVSNTFTTLRELRPYFLIASNHLIKPNVILCQGDFGSIHNVPGETLEKMRNRFTFNIDSLFEEFFYEY